MLFECARLSASIKKSLLKLYNVYNNSDFLKNVNRINEEKTSWNSNLPSIHASGEPTLEQEFVLVINFYENNIVVIKDTFKWYAHTTNSMIDKILIRWLPRNFSRFRFNEPIWFNHVILLKTLCNCIFCSFKPNLIFYSLTWGHLFIFTLLWYEFLRAIQILQAIQGRDNS